MSKNEKRDVRVLISLTESEYLELWNEYVHAKSMAGFNYKWSDFVREKLLSIWTKTRKGEDNGCNV